MPLVIEFIVITSHIPYFKLEQDNHSVMDTIPLQTIKFPWSLANNDLSNLLSWNFRTYLLASLTLQINYWKDYREVAQNIETEAMITRLSNNVFLPKLT